MQLTLTLHAGMGGGCSRNSAAGQDTASPTLKNEAATQATPLNTLPAAAPVTPLPAAPGTPAAQERDVPTTPFAQQQTEAPPPLASSHDPDGTDAAVNGASSSLDPGQGKEWAEHKDMLRRAKQLEQEVRAKRIASCCLQSAAHRGVAVSSHLKACWCESENAENAEPSLHNMLTCVGSW